MHKKDERTGKNFNIVVIGNEATWTTLKSIKLSRD